ncbi:quinone oxidoreductase family protein [Streptantibioticus ferralitis]|uniref:Zinc-binding dehydrogenase n=2 Tax=Streptantibioticus ferralitis TaxID=236510 RepID=A0ABT5Z8N7_9ACTN|nr:zinc-binding dehydrogenase [Streptantibioticus ferralitis]MDF2260083.1 zinc-binding dehydrogenase [Streptantibioticus ferralitis]
MRIHETGGPEVLRLDELDTPVPGPGQLLVRVGAAGVNFSDVMARQGVYLNQDTAPGLPVTLGTEVAGVVAAAGPGVDGQIVGRRVIAFVQGGYAEYAVTTPDLAAELPVGVDLAEATAYLVQGVTAWQLLRDCARIEPGQSVLVHSAAGGVGTLALQLARVFGASTVIATAGSADKRKLALELGADSAVDYTTPEWTEEALAVTGGRGVDIVLDAVGGTTGEQSLDCLAPFGRLVVYGVSSSRLASFAGAQLIRKNQSVIGYWLAGRIPRGGATGSPTAHIVPELLRFAEYGRLRAVVRHAFALSEAAEAHRAVGARHTMGKVVLAV